MRDLTDREFWNLVNSCRYDKDFGENSREQITILEAECKIGNNLLNNKASVHALNQFERGCLPRATIDHAF